MKFGDLFLRYYERHALPRLRCPANVKYWGTKHLEYWQEMEIDSIAPPQIQEWVDLLGVSSPSSATRAVNQFAAILNWGIRRGYLKTNPCYGVERFTLPARDRFLLPDELIQFKRALQAFPPVFRNFVWMSLYTGARRQNVLMMEWSEIDFSLKVWRIPGSKFKNGQPHLVPLDDAAINLLHSIPRKSRWVFPGRRPDAHLKEPKRSWKKLLEASGLSDLHIHDLRRTVGSYMAIAGESLPIIGKALGHRDARSTQIYARLSLAPVRRAFDTYRDLLG